MRIKTDKIGSIEYAVDRCVAIVVYPDSPYTYYEKAVCIIDVECKVYRS